jgi:hypothetical protein
MTKASKMLAGLIALAVGTGLLFSNGAALADGLMTGTRSGIPLGSLVGVIAGHPRLSKEVLIGVRRVLGEVGGEARRSPRKPPISRKTRVAKSGRAITLPR